MSTLNEKWEEGGRALAQKDATGRAGDEVEYVTWSGSCSRELTQMKTPAGSDAGWARHPVSQQTMGK